MVLCSNFLALDPGAGRAREKPASRQVRGNRAKAESSGGQWLSLLPSQPTGLNSQLSFSLATLTPTLR